MAFEILVRENKKTILARLLLKHDALFIKYPEFGVWCYFLSTKNGVVIIEPGPKYNSLSPFLRRIFKKTHNADLILKTLKKHFPNKTISEIYVSHYHFDHSENAPELQDKVHKHFGNTPLIRVHKNAIEKKKLLKFIDTSLKRTYKSAGYRKWKLGDFVKDNEKIPGTDFVVRHIPGHTTCSIGFISKKHKVTISGTWLDKEKDPLKWHFCNLIDEDNVNVEKSVKKINLNDYKHYFFHPDIKSYDVLFKKE